MNPTKPADLLPSDTGQEAIAVLAMACRLPGETHSPEAFWRNLLDRFCAVTPIPEERRKLGLDCRGERLRGAFLDSIDRFDAEFFGISPREATHIDPQHRLFLEVAVEALDAAGQRWDRLAGSRTGVFMGIYSNEYAWLPGSAGASIDVHSASGAGPGIAPNRLSYILDLRGPSLAVDTTCSSSLVATHLAVRSLRDRECSLAIVGGASLMLSPDVMESVAHSIPLASDGRCKPFSADADGTVRGEGCVVFVLKRLQDALEAGDPIQAVILGSAVNQDGRSNGLLAPNPEAQADLITLALADAGVGAEQLMYVETHGTGTKLGDQMELEALLEVLGSTTAARAAPCLIGSVKANIGHLEASAGAAGLLRAVLTVKNDCCAPHPLAGKAHPLVQGHSSLIAVATEARNLTAQTDGVVGVSAFSMGGTNAHVILGRAPRSRSFEGKAHNGSNSGRPLVFPLSARHPESLTTRMRQMLEWLRGEGAQVDARALAYTLCERRARQTHRRAFVASSVIELKHEIDRALTSPAAALATPPRAGAKLCFVFPGHGCQWLNMSEGLIRTEPVFRAAIERMDATIASVADWSLLSFLQRETDKAKVLSSTFGQPALLAVELALAGLFASWGIRPDAVLGYSAGESAAMVLAGLISEAEALGACVSRARVLERVPSGGMLGIRLPETDARRLVERSRSALSLAAVLGPQTCVISGPTLLLEELHRELDAQDVLCIDTGVPYMFHHPMARELAGSLASLAANTWLLDPRLPMYSSVAGARIRSAADLGGDHWHHALCSTLRFSDAVSAAVADGMSVFLEIGPSPVLINDIREILRDRNVNGAAIPTLRRYGDPQTHLVGAVAELFGANVPVSFEPFCDKSRRCISLPAYPWQDRRFWWPMVRAPEISSTEVRASAKPLEAGISYELAWLDAPLPQPEDSPDLDVVAARLANSEALAEYAAVEPQINSICGAYAAGALRTLGVSLEPGERIDTRRLGDDFGMDVARRRLLGHLCGMLADEGYLQSIGNDWRVERRISLPDPDRRLQELLSSYRLVRAEIEMLARCGPRVGDVLAGTVDPLSLLFPQADAGQSASLFGDSGIAVAMNGILGCALEGIAGRYPDQVPLRVLEVGAGTGGTTVQARRALENRAARYVYTDVSRTLLRFGSRRFSGWSALEPRLLDINSEPEAQGFAPKSFDVIIAANVIHAVHDVRRTLEYLHGLLVEGGHIILLEATHPQRIIDLTFGLTRDWWGFTDTDVRGSHPLLPARSWSQLLEEAGFEAVSVCPGAPALADQLGMAVIQCRRRVVHGASPDLRGKWLVLAEADDVANVLAARAQAANIDVRVASGSELENLLIADTYDGLVDLRWLEVAATERWSACELMERQRTLCVKFLHTVQILSQSARRPTRLLFATGGGSFVPLAGGPVDPVQASLTGCIASLAAEHPDWQPQSIDCDIASETIVAAEVLQEMSRAHADSRVAWRNSRRLRPIIRPVPLSGDGRLPVRPDRSYVITGGLGEVGFELAEWLGNSGARHLILAQRSATPGPSLSHRIAALESSGVHVRIDPVDLGNPMAAAVWVQSLLAATPPVGGVIHAAGSFEDCLLVKHEWTRFGAVMAPKIVGAWELHRGLADTPLDFFVLFSSCAEFLDPVGMANYVAANAFLQGLAARRRSLGKVATCVAWGGWSELGMAGRMSSTWEKRWERKGVRGLDLRASFDALAKAIQTGPPVVLVMDVNWQQFAAGATRDQRAIFADLMPTASADRAVEPPHAAPPVDVRREPVRGLRVARTEGITAMVCERAREILQLPDHAALDREVPLADLGFDSLMSLELRDALSAALGIALPATLLFDHPSVGQLVPFLLAQTEAQQGREHVGVEGATPRTDEHRAGAL